MEPSNPMTGNANGTRSDAPNLDEGIDDIDRAFDEMATEDPAGSLAARARVYLDRARSYAAAHKMITAAVGLGLGFLVGRMLRRG